MRTRSACPAALIVFLGTTITLAGDWPAFRGPGGQGVSRETGLPLEWGPEKNIAWKVPLPASNGSPIVVAGKVLVTGATEDGRERTLFCLDRLDGRILWSRAVNVADVEPTHETNTYAPTTPACDGRRVVVWHSSGGLHCYDLDGNPLWSRDLGQFRHMWGFGSSPVIHQGRVFLLCGPGQRQFLIALDLQSGETLWQFDEPGGDDGSAGKRYIGSWATPVVVNVDAHDQILCALPARAAAFDPASGKLLWFCTGLSGRGDLAYASPLAAQGIGVVMGGFNGPAIAFRLGGADDVTEAQRLWKVDDNPQRIGSGVVIDHALYIASADNIGSLQCLDLHTGKELWKVPRLPGGPHWGSMVYADGRLYATAQDATTHVFAPNPEKFEPLAKNELADEHTNSTLAPSDGQFFLRTMKHLYAIGKATP